MYVNLKQIVTVWCDAPYIIKAPSLALIHKLWFIAYTKQTKYKTSSSRQDIELWCTLVRLFIISFQMQCHILVSISQKYGIDDNIKKTKFKKLLLKSFRWIRFQIYLIHGKIMFNPYHWILEKIRNAGPLPSVFCVKKCRAQPWEDFYTFLCFGFFPENPLSHGLKKWHIFLFSTA